jgi:hypothetical protein
MGNINSTDSELKKKSLPQVIDYIATNYILTQNFQDLKNLSDQTYCDKLVVLTSKVIAKKLNNQEIKYLAQRLKEGVEINEMTKDNVIYFERDDLNNLDVKNTTQKRRLCIGIAKFYVKVAHLFAAIITTINPVYTYRTEDGLVQKVDLANKGQIPENAETKITRVGICSNRINALLNNQDFFALNPDDQITINPKFCDMNNLSSSDYDGSNNIKYLSDEPGIPELKSLYLDIYDYDTGKFKDMSPKMKQAYEKDLEEFYKNFTGNKSIPKDSNGEPLIKSFSDIKLRDYSSNSECGTDGAYTKKVVGTLREKLFKQYAEQVKKMINNAETNQDKLLDVLDEVFVFSLDPTTGKKEVIINPKLNEVKLQTIIENARNIIVNLYLTCEKDFVDSLEIFEAIIEKQIFDTSLSQLHELEKSLDSAMIAPPVPIDMQVEKPQLAQDLEQQISDENVEQEQGEDIGTNVIQPQQADVGFVPPAEEKTENIEQVIEGAKEGEVEQAAAPQVPLAVPVPVPVAPIAQQEVPTTIAATTAAPATTATNVLTGLTQAITDKTTALTGMTQDIGTKLKEETQALQTQLTKAAETTKKLF